MPKDIRDILKEDHNSREMNENHRQRFEQRLEALHKPSKRTNFFFLKLAASIILLVGLGWYFIPNNTTEIVQPSIENEIVDLGTISPEMKQIETYYMTAINYEIASLEITPENQEILDDYLDKIGKLTEDYKRLNNQIDVKNIDEKIINELITNLQLRLQILLQLKDELNNMKKLNTTGNEDTTI